MEEANKQLYVGYHRQVITPPMGTNIPGYGALPRLATGISTDLYVQAVAFSDGEKKAILFNCDALGVTNDGAQVIKKAVSERFGLEEDGVYIATTHSHTALFVANPDATNDPHMKMVYGRVLQHFSDCAQFALEDLLPCTCMKIARGEAKGIAFMRRYRMKDGTFRTNPGWGRDDIAERDGIQDESVQLVRIEREGGKEILLVNFGTHPDTINYEGGTKNNTKYCADWPGYVGDFLRSAMEDQVEVMSITGAQGDSNHFDFYQPKKNVLRGTAHAKMMARAIAGEVLKIYDWAAEIPCNRIDYGSDIASIEKNPCEPYEIPLAKEIVKAVKEAGSFDAIPEELKAKGMTLIRANRIVNNLNRPDRTEVPVWGLQIGNLSFIGIPGEPFSEIGIRIKNGSPMDMTMVTCRTNGSYGYFPTEGTYKGFGYERDYSPFGPNTAQEITDASLRILNRMKKI